MILEEHAARQGAKPAVAMTDSGEALTFGELDRTSVQFARALRDAGLGRGSHVAYLLENSLRCFQVIWGSHRIGCYYTPINTRFNADEVAYVLRDSGAEVFVASAPFADVAADALRALDRQLPLALATGGGIPGFQAYSAVVDPVDPRPLSDQHDGASMIYSSGTTGRPKGVKRPLPPPGTTADPDHWLNRIAALFGWTADTQYLCPAPLYHGAGLWYTTAQQKLGSTTFVMPRFDAEQFLAAIERHGITCAQVVPTMLIRMLRLPTEVRRRYDLSSLTHLIHAAAPCPQEVKQEMIDWLGPILYEYYAATEGNGYCWIDSEQWLHHRGSVGRAMLGTPHILDDRGAELPAGEPGLIYFESTGAPFEYHNDTTKTDGSRSAQGWTTVGDMGLVDADGYLYLTDRQSHMIISGGVNIYPQEVEGCLVAHPAVDDVAVIGVPDGEFGEQVKAVVQLAAGHTGDDILAADLIAHCRERLAHYKCPKSVDFVDELPRGDNGKLYKRELRQRYWQGASGTLGPAGALHGTSNPASSLGSD